MATLYLAPLEGITTYVYRNALEKHYGGVDKYFTPFLTASHLKGREKRDVHPDNNKGMKVVPQILTNDAELFVTISKQLAELGYREVNLNLGCPSGTVVSKGRGAGFLDRTKELDSFLYYIYDKLSGDGETAAMEISVKTRIGVEFESEWDDILDIYKKYPISELIIHPRLRNDFYDGEVRLEAYKKAKVLFETLSKEASFGTKLCYNGDIVDTESFERISSYIENSVDGEKAGGENTTPYMIGRGVIANPELPTLLRRYSENESNESCGVKGDTEGCTDDYSIDRKRLRAFLADIVEGYKAEMSNEKQVVMKMKELWTYLAKGLALDVKDIKAIHKTSRLEEYKSVEQMILLR